VAVNEQYAPHGRDAAGRGGDNGVVGAGAGGSGDKLATYVDIEFLTPENAVFSKTPGGFLRLVKDGATYERVSLFRTFPFTLGDRYLSVRDLDGKEIGIIKDMDVFPPEAVEAFKAELARRYFTPTITRIKSMKEEFGYAYWEVETDSGPRRFTVRDMQQNLFLISPVHVMIVDIDGNRFDIPDYTALDPVSRKYIDDLL